MELDALKSRLGRGSIAGVVRASLAIPLYFVLTPFVLHTLGAERFGLWAFGTLVISAMTLTDFGFKNALVYYVARDLDDHKRINGYFNVAMVAFAVLTIAVLGVTYALAPVIARDLLGVAAGLRDEAEFVLWVTAVSFGLRFIAVPYQAVIEGHQRHAVSQTVMLIWLLINFAGTFIALHIRPDIYALGIVSVVSNAAVFVIFRVYATRKHGYLRIRSRHVAWKQVKEMMAFGGGIHAATLLIAAREPVLKVMISRAFDLASVASFEIVYRLCTQIVSFVVTPLVGTFSAAALLSRDRVDELGRLLRPMLGFCLATFVPAVLFFASFSAPLTVLWLGPDYPRVGAMLPAVFTAFAIYYTTEVMYKAIEGSGWSGYSALIQSATLALSVGVFYFFVDNADRAVPMALLAGFVFFSAANLWAFRVRFPTLRLFKPMQLAWLFVPAIAYLFALRAFARDDAPVVFLIYAALHVWCVRRARIFDVVGAAQRLIRLVVVKS